MASASSTAAGQDVTHGVAPLRAGQGISFVLRRLHSLSGIIPVGAFLFEHILVSNSTAITGPDAYARQVSFLANLPLVFFLELFGIWLPIAFHALYGFYIWYRGDGNTIQYPWSGNWMYTAQRWTGGIAFAYILWHTWTMRFTGVDLHAHPELSFGKVQAEVFQTAVLPVLYRWFDRGLVALRIRHLAVLGEVGHRFRGESAEAISGRVFGILLCAERRGTGQPDFIPVAPAATDRAGHRGDERKQTDHGKPIGTMAATPKIIVVGGGLAGLSAVIKIAEMGGSVDLFSIVPVKRSHSVCAQGGINAAKNLKGEGDSTWKHFDDTVFGGDFLANQPPVKDMCEAAPGIIDLLDRMGVPFNRTPEGLLDFPPLWRNFV